MARTNTEVNPSAKDRILAILKRAGSRGATTWMLINETHHSAAARRVWDLQQDGHQIEKVNEGDGVYRWIYRRAPLPKQERLTPFTLLDLIEQEGRTP